MKSNSSNPNNDARFRIRSRARVNGAFFALAPMIDVILLAGAFALFSLAFAKRPGVVVELPRGRMEDGMRSSLHLVAQAAPHVGGVSTVDENAVTTASMYVFFDDARFDLRLENEVSAFITAVAVKSDVTGENGILLHIDRAVAHGDTMALSRMLRTAGIERLCFVIDAEQDKDKQ